MIGMLAACPCDQVVMLARAAAAGLLRGQVPQTVHPRQLALDPPLDRRLRDRRIIERADRHIDLRLREHRKVSGVPQSRQKPRSTGSELRNVAIAPRVTSKSATWP
jgi:hypothetical protein